MAEETKGAKLVVGGFILAGLLMMGAGMLPMLKGGELNATFLSIGALWLILGIALRKRKGS